nr:HAD-IB family hydrolase [uncultured Rhodopila sp.]
MTAAAAVFDLDGTITRGDTYVAYLLHVLRHRPHRLLRCGGLPLVALRFGVGLASNDEVKQRFLQAVAGGASLCQLERLTESFVDPCLRRMAKRAAIDRIAIHARQGDMLILATAGLDLYAAALGARLGFHHVVATRTALDAHRLLAGLDGPNLRGTAKLAAVKKILAAAGVERLPLVAYSDHHSDLPLLQYADEGYAIDPTPQLAREAARLGIPVERWMD